MQVVASKHLLAEDKAISVPCTFMVLMKHLGWVVPTATPQQPGLTPVFPAELSTYSERTDSPPEGVCQAYGC